MHHDNFNRHLREKYSTRLHIADQIIDRLKSNCSRPKSMNETIRKAQQEISFPLISYLNRFPCDKSKSTENSKEFEPYFHECVLAAERLKSNRCSERDRKICYENYILAEKLERIKKPSGQNNHRREYDGNRSTKKRFSETIVTSHSSSTLKSSDNEDDQATAADVDDSIDYCEVDFKQRHSSREGTYSLKSKSPKFLHQEKEHFYQHLNNIDMNMIRDNMSRMKTQNSKHFSTCILPYSDCDYSKASAHSRPCAFKKEILYY